MHIITLITISLGYRTAFSEGLLKYIKWQRNETEYSLRALIALPNKVEGGHVVRKNLIDLVLNGKFSS